MNWKVIFALLMALGCSVALVSCDGSATVKTALEKKLEELQAIFEKTRADRNSLYAEKVRLSYLLKTAESQLVSVTEQRDSLQQQAKELIQAEEQSRSRVDRLAQSEAELQQRINAVDQERDQLQQTVSALTQSRDQLKDRLDEVSTARDELQKQLEAFAQGQGEVEQSIKELTRRWGIALADMRDTQAKIRLLAVPEFVGSTREPEVSKVR